MYRLFTSIARHFKAHHKGESCINLRIWVNQLQKLKVQPATKAIVLRVLDTHQTTAGFLKTTTIFIGISANLFLIFPTFKTDFSTHFKRTPKRS